MESQFHIYDTKNIGTNHGEETIVWIDQPIEKFEMLRDFSTESTAQELLHIAIIKYQSC